MDKLSLSQETVALDAREMDRVRRHTSSKVNQKIDHQAEILLEENVDLTSDKLLARLQELDREWDVDRALMANFAVLGFATSELARRYRGWSHVFHAQIGFLLMHAVVGWCPPLPVFRRLGFRTAKEIATERTWIVELLKDARGPATLRD